MPATLGDETRAEAKGQPRHPFKVALWFRVHGVFEGEGQGPAFRAGPDMGEGVGWKEPGKIWKPKARKVPALSLKVTYAGRQAWHVGTAGP